MALAGQMSNAPGEIGSAFRNADIRFPDIHDAEGNALQVTQGSFIPLMENGDVNVRKAAFESMYHTFASFKHTTAAFLDAQMKPLYSMRRQGIMIPRWRLRLMKPKCPCRFTITL